MSKRPVVHFAETRDRTRFAQANLPLLRRRALSSDETGATITEIPAELDSDYCMEFDRDEYAAFLRSPLKVRQKRHTAWQGGSRARRALRPLALIPSPTRTLAPSPGTLPKVSLMGVPIDCVTERQVIAHVISSIRDRRGGWIVTPNVDQLRIINERPDLMAILSEASLMVADGMPLVWASRLKGTRLPERVCGAGLTLTLTAAASRIGASIFLLGGNPGDAEAAATVLKKANPILKIAGTMCPPLGFETDALQITEIGNVLHSAKPDLVYACFGFPKQEIAIHALRHRLPSAWFLGAGGSLSIVSGRTRRAPRWIQSTGMEWLWRLGLEPRRLFGRYIMNDLPFAIRLLATALVQR